jgi:hypothetical protein
MIAAGRGTYATPMNAFSMQRSHAGHRGIGWELSLWQWWQIWADSGKWNERGRGAGYVMCRQGDVGPYAEWNVFIAPARENNSIRHGVERDLPRGVHCADGRFIARAMVDGRKLHLGTFPSPSEASAAYRRAIGVAA